MQKYIYKHYKKHSELYQVLLLVVALNWRELFLLTHALLTQPMPKMSFVQIVIALAKNIVTVSK